MLPNADPRKARTPVSRQAFTQMPASAKGVLRELNRQRPKRTTGPASEVRFGYRAKDGTSYMFPTASEMAAHRAATLADEALARRQRTEDTMKQISELTAQIDSWASKS